MSRPQPAKPVKLIVSLFLKHRSLIVPVAEALVARFGAIDTVSAWFRFDHTTYYEPEMGQPLFRRVLAFENLIAPEALADIKHATCSLEQDYTQADRRRVNLDPGYLVHERLVLATGKNFTHRIYIGRGVYADLTLIYQKGRFGLRALYASWNLDDDGTANGKDEQTGWYIEPSYRFSEKVGAFARYNSWDKQAGDSSDSEFTQTDFGINYWPHRDVVVKLDYQDQSAPTGENEYDGFNLGLGFQF